MKCKVCKKEFMSIYPLAQVCSVQCSIAYNKTKSGLKQVKSIEKERDNKIRTETETISSLKAKLKRFVQKKARELDANKPCISCGRLSADEWHGGHYYPAGLYSSVMFDLDNIHKQCNYCNKHLHGNLIKYRENLIQRYGDNFVKNLDAKAHKSTMKRKYSRIEILDLLENKNERFNSRSSL
jgi:hypothetical protein